MSPERPPSQSMGGTHLIEQSQQHQSSVAAVSAATTAANMVLSTIPIETGHVVIHHHHPHQQQSSSSANGSNRATTYTQITRNGVSQNLLTTAATAVSSSSPQIATKTISAMTTASSPSKYVVIHQNGNGQYRTTDGTTATYLTAQSNGVGNIVLLATEPMEVTRADQSNIIVNTNGQGTDEELTPLTWLQDKDLLKGLVVRPNGAKTAGTTVSPTRQANGTTGGPISPTSDFLEDSSISEDNVSSLNSSSDQGICISSSEFSPTSSISSSSSVPNSATAFTTYHQTQLQQQNVQYNQVTVGTSGQSQTQHFMNNNNLTKNRNHLLSPGKSAAGIPQSLSGATAYTIAAYNGPSGTTTVVEYKAGTNFSPPPTSARQIVTNHGGILSPQRSPTISAESTSVTITSASIGTGSQLSSPNSSSSSTVSLDSNIGNGGNAASSSATVSITTSTPTTTPHQHYHKKYIREQMNGNDHQQQHPRNGMNESSESRGGNSSQQHHYGQQPAQQQQHFTNASESDDLHHRTPTKPNDSNAIYSNGHEERLMARESLNFDSPIHNGVGCRPPSAQKTIINTTSSTSPPQIPAGSTGMGTVTGGGTTTPSSAASPKQKHPPNVPYDPMVHTTNKPPYSFSSLIFMAIEDSPEKALPVKEIYAWIVQHFPYFKTAPVGWKNSVRHNLSLNKSFLKVEKAPNMGKGSLWRVEEHQRQNLMQALARSPFHQSSAVDKFSPYKSNPASSTNNGPVPVSTSSRSSLPPDSPPNSVKCTVNPELFPKLYKTMNDMANKGTTNGTNDSNIDREDGSQYAYNNGTNGNQNGGTREYYRSNGVTGASGENGVDNNYLLDYSIERLVRDCGADSMDDVHAATAMLALKHGANIFTEHFQNGSPVITSSPSEDHTYSAGGGGNAGAGGGGGGSGTNSTTHSQNGSDNNSSGICSDAAYESGDERLQPPSNRTISAEELEEQRRHAEGVDALLSFASSAASSPTKRPSSTSVEDEHISSYTENIPHYHLPNNQQQQQNGATTTPRYITNDDVNETIIYYRHHNHQHNSSNNSNSYQHHPPQRLSMSSSSSTTYETPNYYLASSAATKKLKTSRGIRTKLKRKTTLIR